MKEPKERLICEVSPEYKRKIEKLIKEKGQTISGFIRLAIKQYLQQNIN